MVGSEVCISPNFGNGLPTKCLHLQNLITEVSYKKTSGQNQFKIKEGVALGEGEVAANQPHPYFIC